MGRNEKMLKADLNFFFLQMSQEESTRFYDQLNHHIFELVSSSDANERKGGILAIGEWKCLMPLASFLFTHLSLGTNFQKEWAFIIGALRLTAQYAGCVLVAGLWKTVCKCQHGSCWVAENLVLNGLWALLGAQHQMWVLSSAENSLCCPFIRIRVVWLFSAFFWGDWFLLLNLPGSITAASTPDWGRTYSITPFLYSEPYWCWRR